MNLVFFIRIEEKKKLVISKGDCKIGKVLENIGMIKIMVIMLLKYY